MWVSSYFGNNLQSFSLKNGLLEKTIGPQLSKNDLQDEVKNPTGVCICEDGLLYVGEYLFYFYSSSLSFHLSHA